MIASREFTAGFLACGLGAGALGFARAVGRLGPDTARFRNLGGVDLDPASCRDFEMLTGAPALQADLHTLTPAELRAAWGPRRPDAIFSSAPCKGFSGLLSKELVANDGTWHRPITRLEFAALQGLPTTINGKPLELAGSLSSVQERIGNAVPVGAGQAIAESLLTALLATAVGGWALGGTGIWVRKRDGWAQEASELEMDGAA